MEKLSWLHNGLLMYVISGVSIFVLVLLVVVCLRFNEKANPKPSKNAHNTLLEIVWTTIPVLILLTIFINSYRIIREASDIPEPEMTLKVVGYQWYWGYQYPDNGNFSYDSYMLQEADLPEGGKRLLEVDNEVVLPVDTTIRVQIAAADVIHAWAVPALGIKTDAVPGRLNETWVRIDKPGVYYGQCSELCGTNHGFMPVVIHAVSKEEFNTWVAEAQQKFAGDMLTAPYKVAEVN
ncbi:MAG: cytochrome c oxidase subunit II [Hyphomicrobiales bacterium]|nr:cytochrome c oxidase subunit II [Hyphomicrobiales bacterium]